MPPNNLEPIAVAVCTLNDFKLVDKLGEGVFKQAFRVASDNSESYALKIYKPGSVNERSKAEISAMSRCDHPCIAKILGIDTVNVNGVDYTYLIEEYFEAGTLEQLLSGGSLLDRKTAVKLGYHLSTALKHLSELRLVHRDIKPANILFSEVGGQPILTDFGLVRDLTATSQTATWRSSGPGTPYFSAPEQLNNQKALIDWRTDQFTLGVTLAIAMLNMHPYQRLKLNQNQVVEAVANRLGPSDEFAAEVAKYGMEMILRMVSPWPVKRYSVPDELIAAFS